MTLAVREVLRLEPDGPSIVRGGLGPSLSPCVIVAALTPEHGGGRVGRLRDGTMEEGLVPQDRFDQLGIAGSQNVRLNEVIVGLVGLGSGGVKAGAFEKDVRIERTRQDDFVEGGLGLGPPLSLDPGPCAGRGFGAEEDGVELPLLYSSFRWPSLPGQAARDVAGRPWPYQELGPSLVRFTSRPVTSSIQVVRRGRSSGQLPRSPADAR